MMCKQSGNLFKSSLLLSASTSNLKQQESNKLIAFTGVT